MRPITQTFLTSSTWTSPPNYQGPVFLQGCGGGNGGSGFEQPGAKASKFYQLMISVEPLTTYDVVVGEGGSGVPNGDTPGLGGNTSFGTLAVFLGGNSTDVPNFPGNFAKGVDGSLGGPNYKGFGGYPGPFGPGGDGVSSDDAIAKPATVPPVLNSGAGGGGAGSLFPTSSAGSAGRLSVTWWP